MINPIPGRISFLLTLFFRVAAILYAVAKEYPEQFAYYYKQAMDEFARKLGFSSGAHFATAAATETAFKIYESKTNTTIPAETKIAVHGYAQRVADFGEPAADLYMQMGATLGYPATNQFVFTVIKTSYKTAELGGKYVTQNGYLVESWYEYGKVAAVQYVQQLTPLILEAGQQFEAIAIHVAQNPEYFVVGGFTTLVALKIYENPQVLWNDLRKLQQANPTLFKIFMGEFNIINGVTREEKDMIDNVDPEKKITISRFENSAESVTDPINLSRGSKLERLIEAIETRDLNEQIRIIKEEKQPTGNIEIMPTQNIVNVPTSSNQLGQTTRQVGFGIDGKKKGFISEKSVPQRTDEFRKFGNKLINIGYLDRNTVSLRSKGGWKLKNTPNKIIGGAVAGVLKAMVDNKPPSAEDVLKLTDDEKDYLNKLTASANVDGFNVPTQKKTEEEKLKHEFEKTRGIIAAGNDNPDLIKSFKRMLVQLIHNKQIPKAQASDVLMELHLLGH